MENKFKNEKELVEWIYTMHLQNTNGRETPDEMFKLGIEAALGELADLKLLNTQYVSNQLCTICGKEKEIHHHKDCISCMAERQGL